MNRIRDLRLGVKLGCVIALTVCVFAAAGLTGLVLSQRAEHQLEQARALETYREDARLLVAGMQSQRAMQAEYLASPSAALLTRFRESGEASFRIMDRLAARFGADPAVAGAVREARRLDAVHDPLIMNRYAPAVRAGRTAEAVSLLRRAIGLIERFERLGETMRSAVSAQIDARQERAVRALGRARTIQLLLGGLAALLAAGLGLLVVRSVTAPIGRLTDAVHAAAGGDLTARAEVGSRDEVGRAARAFDVMLGEFRAIIASAAQIGHSLGTSAAALAASSDQAGRAASEVAASIEVIAGSSEQQAATTVDATEVARDARRAGDEVAERAESAHRAALAADERAAGGAEATRAAVATMGSIESRVGEVHAAVDGLRRDGDAIGRITETLSGIVDQTEMLALNAAIEAARAGDAGRGFAVVAAEVRTLAVEAERSAQEIAALVDRMQQGTHRAADLATRSREDVAAGVRRVADADQAFHDIRTGITAVAQDMEGVSRAAQHVRSGIAALDEGTERLGRMAHSNAAATQEVSAATQESTASGAEVASAAAAVADQARRLGEVVGRFRID